MKLNPKNKLQFSCEIRFVLETENDFFIRKVKQNKRFKFSINRNNNNLKRTPDLKISFK
jgi:hypothetical protein